MMDQFTADPETGILMWKNGRRAGCVSHWGYVKIKLKGKELLAHRVMWEMVNGTIPDGMEIDHRNGVKTDNRISNLRLATPFQNRCNAGKRAHNTTGLKGVFWDKSRAKWVAYIGVNGTQINLGRHITKGLAAVAYAKAALRFHGQFARLC